MVVAPLHRRGEGPQQHVKPLRADVAADGQNVRPRMFVRHDAGELADVKPAVENCRLCGVKPPSKKRLGLRQRVAAARGDEARLAQATAHEAAGEGRALENPAGVHRDFAVQTDDQRQPQPAGDAQRVVGVAADALDVDESCAMPPNLPRDGRQRPPRVQRPRRKLPRVAFRHSEDVAADRDGLVRVLGRQRLGPAVDEDQRLDARRPQVVRLLAHDLLHAAEAGPERAGKHRHFHDATALTSPR